MRLISLSLFPPLPLSNETHPRELNRSEPRVENCENVEVKEGTGIARGMMEGKGKEGRKEGRKENILDGNETS